MAETKRRRESISTRIDHDAHAVIEKVAEKRRTTVVQVARILFEDGDQQAGIGLCRRCLTCYTNPLFQPQVRGLLETATIHPTVSQLKTRPIHH